MRSAPLLLAASLSACAPACTGSSPAAAPGSGTRPWKMWGITIDDVWNTQETVEAIAALPRRPTARIVFDLEQPATTYEAPVRAVRAVADVVGELVDSFEVAPVSPEAYAARAREYVSALGAEVDIWEIGNEVNGEWTGPSADMLARIRAAYDVVKRHGGRTALTLYYNRGCSPSPDRDPFAWAARIPSDIRAGLDHAWLSFHEEDCPGAAPDWPSEFRRLGELFPNAALGLGECGVQDEASKLAALRRCYGISVDHPRFAGGGFWWWFSDDMVPSSRPLWAALRDLMSRRP